VITGSTVDGSLRRAENIAPRTGRAAIAFGDACDRRVSRRRDRRAAIDGFAIAQFRCAIAISAHPITPGRS